MPTTERKYKLQLNLLDINSGIIVRRFYNKSFEYNKLIFGGIKEYYINTSYIIFGRYLLLTDTYLRNKNKVIKEAKKNLINSFYKNRIKITYNTLKANRYKHTQLYIYET